jgi:hypothetical protein
MTISTVSGSSLLFVIASEEASSTGGIWFSVWMCDGIAGEFGTGTELSCTSRSNICDPAGDAMRGEDE